METEWWGWVPPCRKTRVPPFIHDVAFWRHKGDSGWQKYQTNQWKVRIQVSRWCWYFGARKWGQMRPADHPFLLFLTFFQEVWMKIWTFLEKTSTQGSKLPSMDQTVFLSFWKLRVDLHWKRYRSYQDQWRMGHRGDREQNSVGDDVDGPWEDPGTVSLGCCWHWYDFYCEWRRWRTKWLKRDGRESPHNLVLEWKALIKLIT